MGRSLLGESIATVEETTETPEPIQSEKKSDSKLPPGFEAGETKKNIDIEEIDNAIENAPNESYKKNMVAMREKLAENKEKITSQNELITKLKEAGIVDDEFNIKTEGLDKDLQSKLDDAYDKLGQFSLMEDPRFQAKYGRPIESNLKQIVEVIKPTLDDEDQEHAPQYVYKLASMNPVERVKFMKENIPEEYRTVIAPYFARIDEIASERNVALQKHAETKKSLQKEQILNDTNRVEQYRTALRQTAQDAVIKEGFSIFKKKEGNDEYNQFVDALYKEVDTIFEQDDPEVQSQAMLLGAAAPVYKGMYEATEAKLQEALAEIENLKGGRATFGDGDQGLDSDISQEAVSTNKGIASLISKDLGLA